jgi:ketol-acid reductoisomerase
MRTLLEEVRSGAFAREWIAEDAAGRGEYRRLLTNDLAHPIEVVGARLRALMPWLAEQPRSAARTGGRTS